MAHPSHTNGVLWNRLSLTMLSVNYTAGNEVANLLAIECLALAAECTLAQQDLDCGKDFHLRQLRVPVCSHFHHTHRHNTNLGGNLLH